MVLNHRLPKSMHCGVGSPLGWEEPENAGRPVPQGSSLSMVPDSNSAPRGCSLRLFNASVTPRSSGFTQRTSGAVYQAHCTSIVSVTLTAYKTDTVLICL